MEYSHSLTRACCREIMLPNTKMGCSHIQMTEGCREFKVEAYCVQQDFWEQIPLLNWYVFVPYLDNLPLVLNLTNLILEQQQIQVICCYSFRGGV